MKQSIHNNSIFKLMVLALVLAILPLITGCTTTPKTVTVRETKTVVLTPPARLLAPTEVPALAYSKGEWDGTDWPGRSQLNGNQVVILYRSLDMCNRDKASIADYIKREKANVEKNNPK